MKTKYYFIGVILVVLNTITVKGQQDAQYTQYMYNTLNINPGYTGTREALSAVAIHRSQWVGLDGAPVTQTIAVHSPIGRGKIGLGFSAINDRIGPTQETSFDFNVSYNIETSDTGKLSFGLKLGGHLLDVNFDEIQFGTSRANDAKFNTNIDNKFSPNIGLGLFYYTDQFYVGASAPNILQTEHFDVASLTTKNAASFLASERLNYYFMTGYVLEISDDIKMKPALLGKFIEGAPLQIDASVNFLIYEKFIIGAAYRWSAAVSGMAGFQITDKLMLGVGYDWDTSDLNQYNNGSFEMVLRFEMPKKFKRMLTPRFF